MAYRSLQKRLRIAVLIRNFVSTGGGAEKYAIAMAEKMASNHDVHIFAQKIEHSYPGITYHRLWTPLIKPRWINQIWFAVSSWWATKSEFDVVHSHEMTWHGNIQTVHVIPVKYSLFNGLEGIGLLLRGLKVLFSPRLISYLTLEIFRYQARNNKEIIATSEQLKEVIIKSFPHLDGGVEVITPGVESVHPPASQIERAAARAKLNVPLEGILLLFVANDFRRKGLPTLLEAVKNLPDNYYLVVVGNTGQIAEYSEIIEHIRLRERVFFLGARSDMNVCYQSADCLVHPTLEDTFGMVVLEAMACAVPVIVSRSPNCGISELLESNLNAVILANPKDATVLAREILRLNSDIAFKASLQKNGMMFAKNHMWRQASDRQLVIYNKITK